MDLTKEQWERIVQFIPKAKAGPGKSGRPPQDRREVLNGILWILRTGAPWADLPSRYPPYQTCHRRFQSWIADKTLPKILAGLRHDLEKRGGIEDVEGYIDGSYVPAKKKATSSAAAAPATQRRSSRARTRAATAMAGPVRPAMCLIKRSNSRLKTWRLVISRSCNDS